MRPRSRIQTGLWDAFDGEDIEIAYPHQHQVFDETSDTMQVSTADQHGEPQHVHEGRASSPPTDRPTDSGETDGLVGRGEDDGS